MSAVSCSAYLYAYCFHLVYDNILVRLLRNVHVAFNLFKQISLFNILVARTFGYGVVYYEDAIAPKKQKEKSRTAFINNT